jgi:hypothetical protein
LVISGTAPIGIWVKEYTPKPTRPQTIKMMKNLDFKLKSMSFDNMKIEFDR